MDLQMATLRLASIRVANLLRNMAGVLNVTK